jgi:hypothetical protein
MDLEKLQTRKIVAFAVAAISIILIVSAFILEGSQGNSSKEKLLDNIEFQNRQGNVITTKTYVVKLENGSEFRYSKTVPGPGMLCDTNNSKGNCETETELGYTEINSAISSSEYRKQEEDFSTLYYPDDKICAAILSDNNIKIKECG